MKNCLNSRIGSVTVFRAWNCTKYVVSIFSTVSSVFFVMSKSSRLSSWNPIKLYLCVLSVCRAKSFELVPFAISDCVILRLAVNTSFFILLRNTASVEFGTLEGKSVSVSTSQSEGASINNPLFS